MKNFKTLLLAAMLSVVGMGTANAQTADEYEAALAAIEDGAAYRITTDVDGTKYYVTTAGKLTSKKAESGVFTCAKIAEGGAYVYDGENKAVGIQMSSNAGLRFTNPPLNGSVANLSPGSFSTSSNNRKDWETQVLFLKDGKYAIRSCNTAHGESSWADAGRTFFTYSIDPVTPKYSYDPAYVWNFEPYSVTPEQEAAVATVQSWPLYIQKTAGLVQDAAQYASNASDPEEGSLAELLDNKYETFFHSTWHGGEYDPQADHYLQAELAEPVSGFFFYFKKRSQNNNNRPTKIVISASNDGEAFDEIKTIDSGLPTDASVIDYLSDEVDLGAAYKYIRFTVPETNNGAKTGDHVFFTFSEFYLLTAEYQEAKDVCALYNEFKNALTDDLTAENIADIQAANVALKSVLSSVEVSYMLCESDETEVKTIKVVQKPYSDVDVPKELMDKAYYDYDITGEIGEEDCTITIKRSYKEGLVLTLDDLSQDKAYTITCDRGAFLVGDGKNMYSTALGKYKNSAPSYFAIVNYEDHYYLYSADEGKFVLNDGSLSAVPVHGVEDAVLLQKKVGSTDISDPYFYLTFNKASTVVNTNGNDPLGYVINSYSTPDPGNQYYLMEADDFDATDAVDALSFNVIYVVKDAAGNVIYNSGKVPVAPETQITTLPEAYQRPFTKYNEVDVTLDESNTEVEFIATWDGPFQLSTSVEDAKWYNMTIRSDYSVFMAESEPYKPKKASAIEKTADEYQWAFAGDAYNGIVVFNKAAGEGFTLTKDGSNVVMREGIYKWTIDKNQDGFTLMETGTANNYVNQNGGASGPLQFWNSSWGKTDNGSTFRISEVPADFDLTITDAGYATLYLPYPVTIPSGVQAYTGVIDGNLLMMTEVETTIPAATPVVLKGAKAGYTFEVAGDVDAIGSNDLKGTYVEAKPEGALTLQVLNGVPGFYTFTGEKIGANKAYLVLPEGGEVKLFFGETDGISSIETANDNVIFDLSGRRVQKLQKGVYIVNGKKVMK